MKHQYLFTTVFYGNQYLSAGKEKEITQLLKSKVCDFYYTIPRLLSLPLNTPKSNPNPAQQRCFCIGHLLRQTTQSNAIFSAFCQNP